MSWRRFSRATLPFVAGLGLTLGCRGTSPQAPAAGTDVPALPPALQANRAVVNNDRAALAQRLVHAWTPLHVRSKGGAAGDAAIDKPAAAGVRLTLVGHVRPPEVDGHVVQANDVEIQGRTAIVAYNFAGETFAGAVQVVDFARAGRPELVSEVVYRNADVNAVALEGQHLFVGLAVDEPTLATPAALHEFELTGSGLAATGDWLDLPSWAVTDLAVHGNRVVAGVGADLGGVALVERDRLRLRAFADAADVRGVAASAGQSVTYVAGGQAHLGVLAVPGLALKTSMAVDGYQAPAAKGTIEAYSHRCYLGAGDGGMQVWSGDGVLLDALANEAMSERGGRSCVVNAVSVSQHLGFVAAGPAGVQVVDLGRWRTDGRAAESRAGLRVLGELVLEDGASTNMVKARGDILVVAAGLGGVKLIEMDFESDGD